ncbi:hypothetical protein IQ265_08980 [Nodosilinea sp. LEGE 06152]|uniref:hypothetical protein n=1 Tax=Nodosilinea sp. LEGE 06152 TaxID=2777966 RepID=UPI00187EC0BD|nr:hypothetical protein [Nodosilinea sp. LEGE 06152]MBE9156960.1 hypothetical protein [Nodosilinea sp. LEGE 06152]
MVKRTSLHSPLHRIFWRPAAIGSAGGLLAALVLPLRSSAVTPPVSAAPRLIPHAPGTAAHPVLTFRTKQTPSFPAVPPLPDSVPDAIDPDEAGIVGLNPAPNDDIGLGHLRPTSLSSAGPNAPQLGAEWLRGVALPIYPTPESEHWGWLINGWLVPNDADPLAIGRDAAFSMVQTDQQIYTFPVLEVRPDGWFRFQYTPAGTAWAHTSHLDLGAVSLTVETWEASLESAARIQFRRPGLSQPMRLAPTGTAPLQALVGPNSIIQPLDLDGDWLQVRVTQPAQGCTPLPGSSTEEGWVRWRSETDVPLIWFAVTDCQTGSRP